MILTMAEAKENDLLPITIKDANGKEITGPVLAFDTETGNVILYKTDPDGDLEDDKVVVNGVGERLILNEEGTEFERIKFKYPAPLTWESENKTKALLLNKQLGSKTVVLLDANGEPI